MAISIFGETGGEIFEIFIKLAPAATIVAAIIAARLQFKNARKLNQEVIAKNHYREMIEIFLQNSDIYFRGMTEQGFSALKKEPADYRKYRLLFNILVFAMQELYLSVDANKEPHLLHMCRGYILMFKPIAQSSDEVTEFHWACLDPRFVAFFKSIIAREDHPFIGRREAAVLTTGG